MMRVRFTANATRQLRAIFDHIAIDNLDAAQRVLERILTVGSGLANNPLMGRKVSGRRRRLIVTPYPYLLYYDVTGDTVRILQVRHAARYRAAFQEPVRAFAL
jgi:plasmid stabilization system protein ParE